MSKARNIKEALRTLKNLPNRDDDLLSPVTPVLERGQFGNSIGS
jgi:hypothetical protein